MSISITRYVDISAGVAGQAALARRDLMARIFTDNVYLPINTYLEFSSAEAVGAFFGTASQEYARAVFYFGWVSKDFTAPRNISFARWDLAGSAPAIYGNPGTYLLATFTAISNGSLGLTIGADVNTFTALDFSAAASLADVATVLQTAVRAKSGSMWTAATVSYDATRGCFNLVGGAVVGDTAGVISVQDGVGGTNIATLIGWKPQATFTLGVYVPGAIWANGSTAQETDGELTATLAASAALSDNFGSFLLMPSGTTLAQRVAAATWNQTQNVKYIFTTGVSLANMGDYFTALQHLEGTAVTLSVTGGEYPEQVPMMILAATDYDLSNSVQNYMYQQFALTPSVTTDSGADTADSLRTNYYGRTQEAGRYLSFYQQGLLMGDSTAPIGMNVYANEIWLKDASTVALANLLVGLGRIPANEQGRGYVLATLQSVVDQALSNGTISVGKLLTAEQKAAITSLSDDPKAWYQVQNSGYWLNCIIQPYDSPVKYRAVFTLIYSKDDVVIKVVGTQVLI